MYPLSVMRCRPQHMYAPCRGLGNSSLTAVMLVQADDPALGSLTVGVCLVSAVPFLAL